MRDWADILPEEVARNQQAYERRMTVYRMHRDAGMPQKDIAANLGVTPSRVHQMLRRAAFDISRDRLSPCEAYLADGLLDHGERRACRAVVATPPFFPADGLL